MAALAGSLGAYFTTVVTVEEYRRTRYRLPRHDHRRRYGFGDRIGLGAVFITLLPFAVERVFEMLPPWQLGTTSFGIQQAAVGVAIIGFLLSSRTA